jgi:gamma-glutamylcyclotransferase (GGCT)/AIG2-like uncharacterized protein YtfP
LSTPSEAKALFVYGSLTDRKRRIRLIGRAVRTRKAMLPDYRRSRGRYFYVVPAHGASTPGLLLLDLTPAELAALDRYEEVPQLYRRQIVHVIDARGLRHRCWVYLPTIALLAARD